MDWARLLAELDATAMIVALIALLGVLVGHWFARRGKREDLQLARIDRAMGAMQAEIDMLNKQVSSLRDEMDRLQARLDSARRKYRCALEFVRGVLDAVGAGREVPPVPDLIRDDL